MPSSACRLHHLPDRKSTRLNSSHLVISYAVFCLKKKSLGLFACGKYGATGPVAPDNSAPLTGLFYGGGTQVLIAQAIGSLIVTSATFSVDMAVLYLVNLTGTLRVSAEGEVYGLDLHEHGISAYPEYVISALNAPAGMTGQAHAVEPSP